MTVRDLSQYHKLKHEIEDTEAKLAEMEGQVGVASPGFAPGKSGHNGSVVEKAAVSIVDLQAILQNRKRRAMRERIKLELYIDSIQDSLLRQIFVHRFVDGLSWSRVADAIGGGMQEDSVKKACYRYLKSH